jgi:hypothetical protein
MKTYTRTHYPKVEAAAAGGAAPAAPTLPKAMMPWAADIQLSLGVLAGGHAAVRPLPSCWSHYRIDRKSVKITGLAYLGQENIATKAVLKTNGKSLTVVDEGYWAVGDSGEIAFQASTNLTHAPTAISYQFADMQGNLSNEAVVIIDEAVGELDPLLDGLAGLWDNSADPPDGAFWINFQDNVSRDSTLEPHHFITIAQVLAGTIQTLVAPGPEPVSSEAYDAAYQAWDKLGQAVDDPVGATNPIGLVYFCQTLVEGALPGATVPWLEAYWRLTLMARMMAQALPDKGN